jgi:3-oxoacyl-[acyl-carrier protein] reductase
MPAVYLALGANLGDPVAQMHRAVDAFVDHPECHAVCASTFITSDPVDCPDGSPPFTNAAMSIETTLTPHELLAFCQHLETVAGRDPHRAPLSNTPRPLDVDILFYGDHIIETPELVIPHPRLHERAFVLGPLCELNPLLVHPILKQSIATLLEGLKD